jgi:catechol 2,3-dioxygenase-like lactoylglutathione lyase family enzyme
MTPRATGSACLPAAASRQSASCANGANIELFEFYSPNQRESFPRPNDVEIQHLALYVDELDAAAEHLRRHGIKLMTGPNPLPGPEAGEGNLIIYARTPWGLTVELISYPSSMAYEQHSEVRRWRPMTTNR